MAGTENIKKLFIKQKKVARDPDRKPILKTMDQFNELLLIADADPSNLANELSAAFRHAKISFLFPRKNKEDNTAHGTYCYHASDLNLTGKIKNDKLKQLMQIQFDLILDLSTDEILNQYLLKKLSASFIIGKKGIEKSEMYDLLVSETTNNEEFIQTITKQITLLSQNGTK
ncbi:MAG: hypothetical protein GQ574_16930 [Crocinitomix sp.]|nr:hypothetical protein [Crocinitomix sp.]